MDGRTDGRTDDAKTISLRLRRGIKIDGCLNEELVEYVTWILSSEFHTLYKEEEKVLTRLRICRHAFVFNARKCVKYKYFSSSLQSKLYN